MECVLSHVNIYHTAPSGILMSTDIEEPGPVGMEQWMELNGEVRWLSSCELLA